MQAVAGQTVKSELGRGILRDGTIARTSGAMPVAREKQCFGRRDALPSPLRPHLPRPEVLAGKPPRSGVLQGWRVAARWPLSNPPGNICWICTFVQIKMVRPRGVRPINHMVVVRHELSERHPDVVAEVHRMLSAAVDTTKSGFRSAEMRRSLECITAHCAQQGLIAPPFAVNELFDDVTPARWSRRIMNNAVRANPRSRPSRPSGIVDAETG